MTAKTIEIRDRATFIPALVIRLEPGNEADRYLLSRSGFSPLPERQREFVLLLGLDAGEGRFDCDPHGWGNRTQHVAHDWIIKHFDEIESGAVVDVQFILGETTESKQSEAIS